MWKLHRPEVTASEAYLTCISRVRSASFKARLELAESDILKASEDFEKAAKEGKLHALASSINVGGIVSKEEMFNIYESKMARRAAPGRAIYDKILTAPEHGRCPLCGQRQVSTLDHYLPKSHFPALAVLPSNLVPACVDCNKAKLDTFPKCRGDETLHPYYDDVERESWLSAKVLELKYPVIQFYVNPPDGWDEVTIARVRRHFKMLGLSYLYASQAAVELTSIKHYISELFREAGVQAVKRHLLEMMESCRKAQVNSWRTVTYQALSESDWYCAGGFF